MNIPNPSTKNVIFRIALIIAVSEFISMMILILLPSLGFIAEAVIDVLILSIISTPLIYFLVVKPFVTARDHAIDQVNQLALTDTLTQISNRRHLLQHLHRIMAICHRHRFCGALILIDLDGFKPINDMHGHDAGDAVLIEIAKRFRALVRAEDILARLGGDEFIIISEHFNTDAEKARAHASIIAEKLIAVTKAPILYKNFQLQVGASAGITMIKCDTQDPDSIIRMADVALYQSKRAGKGRATFLIN